MAWKFSQLTYEGKEKPKGHHEVPDVGAGRVDVVLEAKGGTHKDEGLQVEVPRGERLESREDL